MKKDISGESQETIQMKYDASIILEGIFFFF